jgi:hypothetical protein
MTYTEEQIREVLDGYKTVTPYWIERVMTDLRLKSGDSHAHDWADDDTITVREITEAWNRGNSTPARNSLPNFLQDISERRENFPPNAVVEDPEGNIWRLQHTRWQVFNSLMTVSYETPRRPLRQIGVDSRHDS